MTRERKLGKRWSGLVLLGLIVASWGPVDAQEEGYVRGLVNRAWGYADPEFAEIVSVHQLAKLIDRLDESLYDRGPITVKGPDVWGANRMTQQRAEYEDQMK